MIPNSEFKLLNTLGLRIQKVELWPVGTKARMAHNGPENGRGHIYAPLGGGARLGARAERARTGGLPPAARICARGRARGLMRHSRNCPRATIQLDFFFFSIHSESRSTFPTVLLRAPLGVEPFTERAGILQSALNHYTDPPTPEARTHQRAKGSQQTRLYTFAHLY